MYGKWLNPLFQDFFGFIISAVINFSSESSGNGQSTINWSRVIFLSADLGAIIGFTYVVAKELCRICDITVDFDGILRYPEKTINKVAFGLEALSSGFVVQDQVIIWKGR